MSDIEALRELRQVVEAAPKERFRLNQFMTLYDGQKYPGCQTAFCSAGWAAMDPWFASHTTAPGPFPTKGPDREKELWMMHFRGWCSFKSLQGTFQLTLTQTEILFGAGLSPRRFYPEATKHNVLQNIDRLIEGHPELLVSYRIPK